MYEPIRPVKNMISVARNSHIATLPGVTGGCWTAVTAAGVTWSASAVSVVGWAVACAISKSTFGTEERRRRLVHAGIGFRSKSIRIAGRYTNEARNSRRAERSETSDQNRTAKAK